jgi:hypothetical protein
MKEEQRRMENEDGRAFKNEGRKRKSKQEA